MHHESEWEPIPERECGDEVHILGKKIAPVWPFLDGLPLDEHTSKFLLRQPRACCRTMIYAVFTGQGAFLTDFER